MTLSRTVVVVDAEGDFYPPAAVAMGLPADRLLVVRVSNAADAFWATEQAVRCRAVGAVIATRLVLDDGRSRRLQLAAERSGGLALVLGPSPGATARHTFAAVQLRVEPLGIHEERRHGGRRHEGTEARRHEGEERRDQGIEGTRDRGMEESVAGGRRVRITFLKVREGRPVKSVIVSLADETFDVPVHPVPADRAVAASRSGGRRISA